MAANFWQSTHYKRWLLDKSALSEPDPELVAVLGEGGIRTVHCYFIRCIYQVGKCLKFKQRVLATAALYYKRFFIKRRIQDFDPRLVVPTSLYLAGKVEECAVRAEDVVTAVSSLLQRVHLLDVTPAHILECEFHVLETLNFDLVVHHPYTVLVQYVNDLQQAEPGMADDVMQIAWNLVNDSYYTDAPILFPPFLIALSALSIACVSIDRPIHQWLERLNMNEAELANVNKQILALLEHPPSLGHDEMGGLVEKLGSICPALGPASAAFAAPSQ